MSETEPNGRALADACVKVQMAQDLLIEAADLMRVVDDDQSWFNEADIDLAIDRLRVTRDSLIGRVLGRA